MRQPLENNGNRKIGDENPLSKWGRCRASSRITTDNSIENALRVLLAIGGSTNAIIHLTAIAGRAGIPVSLRRFNELSDTTPVLVDLKPTGSHYMEDFHATGGMAKIRGFSRLASFGVPPPPQ